MDEHIACNVERVVQATPTLRPTRWAEALELRAAHPDALAINGGTDVMVEINFDRRRPAALLDLSHVSRAGDVGAARSDDGHRPLVRLGAGVTYTHIVDELADLAPCLAMASRTIGSPQIRNRGTVGGNLGTASPAGDAHPPLLRDPRRRRDRERDRPAPRADRRLLRRPEAQRARIRTS